MTERFVPHDDIGHAPNNVATAAAAASLIIKAAPGILYGLALYSARGSVQFIQLHDSATLPADTAVPALSLVVAATANLTLDFGVFGMKFVNGIVVCNSSTVATKTIGSADCTIAARFK